MMNRFENSTGAKISSFLKTQKSGQTFIIEDFEGLGSYTCVRSAIVRLCEHNELTRVCQGIYMKPGKMPDVKHIANEIARKNGAKACIKGEEYKGSTHIVYLNTNGSTRSITLPDGTVLKYNHIDNF